MWSLIPYQLAFYLGTVATGSTAAELSDSAFGVGVVVGAWGLPVLLLPPLGGVAADRFDGTTIFFAAQTALGLAAAAIAILAWFDVLELWHLVALGLVQGTTYAFFVPARVAWSASIVGPDRMTSALAVYMLAESATGIAGPILAALVLGLAGVDIAVGYALIAVLHALVLWIMRPLPEPASAFAPGKLGIARRVGEAWSYVRRTPPLPQVIALAAVATLTALQAIQLLPVFAETVFATGAAGLGLFLAVASVGRILGSLVAARSHGDVGAGRRQRLAGAAFGLSVVGFAIAPTFPSALLLIGAVGATSTAFLVMNGALVVTSTDPGLYGRVTGLYQLTFSLTPIGAIPVAALADRIGPQLAVAMCGVALLAAACVLVWKSGDLGRRSTATRSP